MMPQSSRTLDIIHGIEYDQISLCDQPAISHDQPRSQPTAHRSTFEFPLSSHFALVSPAYYLTNTALKDDGRAHFTCIDGVGVQAIVSNDVNWHRFRLEVVVQLLRARRFARTWATGQDDQWHGCVVRYSTARIDGTVD